MIVTGIEAINKSRVRVYIDHEFAFVLYKGELHTYGISESKEIKPEDYNEITKVVLSKRVKLRAMNLLTKRSYTTAQLKEKLRQGEYNSILIEDAISYVSSFGYLNDEQYAADFIEYNRENKSKRRILSDLSKKGIGKDIVEKIWQNSWDEKSENLEKEQMIRLLRKRNYDKNCADYKETQKMAAYLYQKGFPMDAIRNVLSLDITSI